MLFRTADTATAGGGPATLFQAVAPTPATDPGGAPSSAPAPASWVNPDGTLADNWRSHLGPEFEADGSLSTFRNVADLAKSYVGTKKMVGAKVSPPGENATPEQLAAWRKNVGAPESPEKYYTDEVKTFRPQDVPETLWDAKAEKDFLAVAHKHHLPPAAVKEILGFHGQSLAGALAASKQEEETVLAEEMGKLRTAWGDKLPEHLAKAQRIAAFAGLEPTHPMFTDSRVMLGFAKLAELMGEDTTPHGGEQGASGNIHSRIADIHDPSSTSRISRAYHGHMGQEEQLKAQAVLHGLRKALGQ